MRRRAHAIQMEANNDGVVDKAKLLAGRPDNLHKGSYGSSDLDLEAMIEESGCSKPYYELEECLGEHDRNWTKCQQEVVKLKECNRAMTLRKEGKGTE